MAPRKISLEEQFGADTATVEFLRSQKQSTQYVYKQHWRRFLEFTEMTGNQILESRRTDKTFSWEKKVLEFRGWVEQQPKKRNPKETLGTAVAKTAVGVVRGFFGFHRVDLKFRRTESTRLSESERKYEDYRFTRDNLHNMCKVADLQGEYVVTVGKSFGLRTGDFMSLTRGDLEPYLDREVPISIGEYSTKKRKAKAFPFIDADALPIIKLMIAQMDREGRTAPTDRILKFKSNIQLSRILRSLAAKAGINPGNKVIRFHCLRKFLADRLSAYMSESKWKQIIGKKISEKAYVSSDELRKDYARTIVDTCWTGVTDQTDVEKRVKFEMLRLRAKELGFSDEEIEIKLTRMELDEFEKYLRKEARNRQRSQQSHVTELNGGNCQKIVSEEELGGYLAKGWKVQAVLPSGRIVVDNES